MTIVHEKSTPRGPTRVVLLGGTGFLGRGIQALLTESAIDSLILSSMDLNLSASDAAARLASMLRPTDSIVMLAATKPGRRLDEEGLVANIAMGASVCKAIRASGCSHLVYLSSDAVYPFGTEPIVEETTTAANTLYAAMHLEREVMFNNLEGMPVAILRSTQVYGPGDHHRAYGPVRMAHSAVSEGRIVLYGSGEETRDHIHVRDLASVIVSVLEMSSRGVLNVASGRSVSFADLAEIVRSASASPVLIQREPRRMPVLHRRFDISNLERAFPRRSQTPLGAGIATLIVEKQRITAEEKSFSNSLGRSRSK